MLQSALMPQILYTKDINALVMQITTTDILRNIIFDIPILI